MLTLKQFELQISNTIVYRGREYYENAAVIDLEEIEADCWHAEVKGSDTYTVEIKLFKKDKIKSYTCDCPYDGNVCKHVVAVLFLLREKLINTAVLRNALPKDDFSGLLQKIGTKELQEFILIYAAKDEKFKSLFERHFASKDKNIDLEEKYAALLKSLIDDHSRDNFISYKSVQSLAGELAALLEEGEQLIKNGDFRKAFILARSMTTAVIELLAYSDDSSGYIGDMISSSIALIVAISETESVAADLLEEIFDFIQSAVNRSIYFDYGDFGYEMANVYQTLALKLGKEHSYMNFIDGQMKAASADKYSYKKDYFLVRKIAFLKAIGNDIDARKLLYEHIEIVDVRRGEVSSLIAKGDFSSAKKLIVEGIDIARKKRHPGTVTAWEEALLHIAVLENDIAVVRHYTRRFAFDRGFHQGYYNQWKHTFTVTEWEEEIENFIAERIRKIKLQFQRNKGKAWYLPDTVLLDMLAPIYVEEKYLDRLLALMSKETDLDRLLQYHHYLVKVYPLQLLTIYLPAFMRKGDTVGNRSQYADLASKMKMVIETIPEGKEEIIAVAEEINRKYTRRPAMIAALNAVIKMRDE